MTLFDAALATESPLQHKLDLKVDLSRQRAVVLGGSGSIGEEIALSLLENGARVTVTSRNTASISQRLSHALDTDPRLAFVASDASKEDQIASLVRHLEEEYGGTDILILAQGVQHRAPIVDCSLENFEHVLRSNLTAAFLALKVFGPPMLERGSGRVIALTSLTSEIGIPTIGPYAASKGGLNQLLRTVAVEWAPKNVTVNSIAPGRIKTRMTRDLLENEAVLNSNLSCIPQGRIGEPHDISGAALFLCSQAASYITGQTLFIDGGWLAGGGSPSA
jgi:NAD(P)-dependent dehydrogenase (short-subunit alcohol dehydrogenase family)